MPSRRQNSLVFSVSGTLLTAAHDHISFLTTFLFAKERVRSLDAIRQACNEMSPAGSGSVFLTAATNWSPEQRKRAENIFRHLGFDQDASLLAQQVEEQAGNGRRWEHAPGAVAALELLRRCNWNLGADLADQPELEQAITDTGLLPYFEWVKTLQKESGFEPAECWYVGSNPEMDPLTASQGGIKLALVCPESPESAPAFAAQVTAPRVDLVVKRILDLELIRV